MGQSNAAAALDLLDRAAQAAGQDANLIRPRTARVRARALAALGRTAVAENEIDNGLVAAREHALRYDEALLLALRAEIATNERSADDAALATQMLESLGVQRTPRPEPKSDGCRRKLNRASVATRGVVSLNVGVLDHLDLVHCSSASPDGSANILPASQQIILVDHRMTDTIPIKTPFVV